MDYKYSFLTFIEYGGALIKDASLPALAGECIDLGMKLDKSYREKKQIEIGGTPESAEIRHYIRIHYPKENLSKIDFSKFDLESDEFKNKVLPYLLMHHEFFQQMSKDDIDYLLQKANIMAVSPNKDAGFLISLIKSRGKLKFNEQQLHYIIDKTNVNPAHSYANPLIHYYLYVDKAEQIGFTDEHLLKIIERTNITKAANKIEIIGGILSDLSEDKLNEISPSVTEALVNKFFPDTLTYNEIEGIFRVFRQKLHQSYCSDIDEKTDIFFSTLWQHHHNKDYISEMLILLSKKVNTQKKGSILSLPRLSILIARDMLEKSISKNNNEHLTNGNTAKELKI